MYTDRNIIKHIFFLVCITVVLYLYLLFLCLSQLLKFMCKNIQRGDLYIHTHFANQSDSDKQYLNELNLNQQNY